MTRRACALLLLCLLSTATAANAASEYFYSPGSPPFASGTAFGCRGRVVDVVEVKNAAGTVVRRSATVNVAGVGGSSTNHQISISLAAAVYDEDSDPLWGLDWFSLVSGCPNAAASVGGIDGTGESLTFGRVSCPAGERGTCVAASGAWGTAVYLAEAPHLLPVAAAVHLRPASYCF